MKIDLDLFDRMLEGVAEPACRDLSRNPRVQAAAMAAAFLLVPAARAAAQDTCTAPCSSLDAGTSPVPVAAEDLRQTEPTSAPDASVAAPEREITMRQPPFGAAPSVDVDAGEDGEDAVALPDPTLSASLPSPAPDGETGSAEPLPVGQPRPAVLSTTEPAPEHHQALVVGQGLNESRHHDVVSDAGLPGLDGEIGGLNGEGRGGLELPDIDLDDDLPDIDLDDELPDIDLDDELPDIDDWENGRARASGACHDDGDAPLAGGGISVAVGRDGGVAVVIGNGFSKGEDGRHGGHSFSFSDSSDNRGGRGTADLRQLEAQVRERVMEMVAGNGWSYEVADDGSMRNSAQI